VSARARGDRNGGRRDLPRPNDASPCMWPRKEGQDRSRCTFLIPEIEVIRPWVVEVDRELDQSQAENRCVEVEITLRITGNGGDVMDAGNGRCRHGASPLRSG